jgi:hypothetical protein
MQITYLIVLSAVLFCFALGTADWENPAVNQINTEPPHATFIPFVSKKDAL